MTGSVVNIGAQIFQGIYSFLDIVKFILLCYVLVSFFPQMHRNSIVQLLIRICEPFLAPFRPIGRSIAEYLRVPFDFTIIITFIMISVLTQVLVQVQIWLRWY